jgi:outer membrane PBP1 activator LpoA protein
MTRRAAVAGVAAMVMAGCTTVPRTAAPSVPAERAPAAVPSEAALPTDQTRHRVALLVPLSGENGTVGQSIANATMMALLDTDADNLRITNYDTAGEGGARTAATRAVQDGNSLILGPLLGQNIGQVVEAARPRGVPVISFSNDSELAGPGVFVMGVNPEQSVRRSINFARAAGSGTFAALVPEGEYGSRARAAFQRAVVAAGGRVVRVETFQRGNTSIVSAAQRIKSAGKVDAVYIADSPRIAALGARELGTGVQIIGNEMWSGDSSVTQTPALRGAIFSAVSDDRYRQFVQSYRGRFQSAPYRVATLGYDAVLLALNIGENWRYGRAFPTSVLTDREGFLGLDGPFRFSRNGVVERAMEVRQVRGNEVVVADPAPASF